MLEDIANNINTLGDFCGKRDVAELTSEQIYKKYGIAQADVMVLFGVSILCGGDVLAQAMKNNVAKKYVIVGGAGHTTETLRLKMHERFPDIETAGLPEAEVFAKYLKHQYGLEPDFLECKSTNCGNNITYLLDLLRENGELALITTNYFPTATGAKNLRNDFKTRCSIRKLINFNEVKVFESALGQHNMITMIKKCNPLQSDILCTGIQCTESYVATSNQISDILKGIDKNVIVTSVAQENLYDGEEAYIRMGGVNSTSEDTVESALEKISEAAHVLGDYAEVNQGVLTGCDTVTNKHLAKLPPNTQKCKGDGIFVLDYEVPRDVDVVESFANGKQLLKDFYKNSDISVSIPAPIEPSVRSLRATIPAA